MFTYLIHNNGCDEGLAFGFPLGFLNIPPCLGAPLIIWILFYELVVHDFCNLGDAVVRVLTGE
ncbi:hypothetical protein T11_14722 [Trichinella zimbabwensis]|uniref:Uncharacterized protein n=1 Tax=Trichinella zimbabwensis TaxID=268475 RepID=A0A0V1I913_9BILA|nr:hypothetical protein T11_14722 [Trichinella zimbabwensis]